MNSVDAPQAQLLSFAVTDEATRQLELSCQSVKGRTYTVLEGSGERLAVRIPQNEKIQFFKVSVELTPQL